VAAASIAAKGAKREVEDAADHIAGYAELGHDGNCVRNPCSRTGGKINGH
jgi:hypothetical protein